MKSDVIEFKVIVLMRDVVSHTKEDSANLLRSAAIHLLRGDEIIALSEINKVWINLNLKYNM